MPLRRKLRCQLTFPIANLDSFQHECGMASSIFILHLCPHAVRVAWVLLLAKFRQAIAHVLPRGPLDAVSGKTDSLARAPPSRAAVLVSTGQAGGKTLEVSHRCIAQTSKPTTPYSRAKLSALASEQKFRHGGPPIFNLCPVPYPNLISHSEQL